MTGLAFTPGGTVREGNIPVLETDRLILRAPRLEDVKAVATIANDRRIAENTACMPCPYRPADAKAWIAGANLRHGEETYVITLADGPPIGACDFRLREDTPEVGCWLGVAYWGNGYATEAVRTLIDRAFGGHEYAALQAGARVTNPASRRVLEKCGFQWTGVGLCRIRAIDCSAPVDRFRLDRRLWASLKSGGRSRGAVS